MTDAVHPPVHVVAAFGADNAVAERLPGVSGRVWRYGDIVLRPAGDPVAAAWESGVFESLRISGIRVPRPVRSLDGRWVVGGWRSERFLSGRPAARFPDVLAVAFELDLALQNVEPPRHVLDRTDQYGWLDRLSWDPEADAGGRLGDNALSRMWFEIASGRMPVLAPRQVIHGDLFGNVLFAGTAPPAVIDFIALARPAGFAAALVVVDAVAWGGAPVSLAAQGQHVPQWGQLLRRACLFRLAMVLTHRRTTQSASDGLTAAIIRLRPHLV
jgi:uncharacterized protein (TIGR02569 family)